MIFPFQNRNNSNVFIFIIGYQQIVQDTMCRFVCGYAQCGNTKTYVCNYAGGELKYNTPFISGSKCQDCPSRWFEGNCG